jgi:hypothetical protein
MGDAPGIEKPAEERRGEEAVRAVGHHECTDWTTRRGDCVTSHVLLLLTRVDQS